MCFDQCVATSTDWSNAFDESFLDYIDIPEIIPRIHSTNVFFRSMGLARFFVVLSSGLCCNSFAKSFAGALDGFNF